MRNGVNLKRHDGLASFTPSILIRDGGRAKYRVIGGRFGSPCWPYVPYDGIGSDLPFIPTLGGLGTGGCSFTSRITQSHSDTEECLGAGRLTGVLGDWVCVGYCHD